MPAHSFFENLNFSVDGGAEDANTNFFFVPDVLFQAQVDRPFRGGASSSGLGVLDGVGALFPELSFSEPDDFNWTLALDLSIPLFTSGNRTGVRDRDVQKLSRLRFDPRSQDHRYVASRCLRLQQ